MTIDDAIVAFEQVASGDYDSLELDVRDYERLVKWLTELKLARESAFSDIGLAARAVSENHQLKAENAQLRTQLADVTESMGRVEERCAKLRELASILCFCMQIHKQCDDCKLNGAKGDMAHDPLLACDGLHEMLRELGIEVGK